MASEVCTVTETDRNKIRQGLPRAVKHALAQKSDHVLLNHNSDMPQERLDALMQAMTEELQAYLATLPDRPHLKVVSAPR